MKRAIEYRIEQKVKHGEIKQAIIETETGTEKIFSSGADSEYLSRKIGKHFKKRIEGTIRRKEIEQLLEEMEA